jgi:hypothetical protein
LDFEHYQSRVDSSLKKTKRSDRDNAALAKAEADLAKAKEVCIFKQPISNYSADFGSGL